MTESLITQEWEWFAGLVVVHLLWQGAVVGLLAALALRAVRHRSPQVRYLIACACLLLLAGLLPLNLVWLGDSPVAQSTAGFSQRNAAALEVAAPPQLDPATP